MKLSFRATNEALLDDINTQGTIAFTNEKNMYIVGQNGSKLKITDNIFLNDESELETTKKFLNKIYITKNNWKMYTWTGEEFKVLSGGGGGSGSTETLRETIIATEGQTGINIPFSFTLGGSLKVYKNGVLQNLNTDYTEVNSKSISMIIPCTTSDNITVILESGGSISLTTSAYDLQIEYNIDETVHKETYTGGVEKIVTYEYNTNGLLISKTTDRKGVINTATFVYDEVLNLISITDNGTDIAVLSTSEGTTSVQNLDYHLDIEYLPNKKIGKEIYTGNVERIVTYEYDVNGWMLSKNVEENGKIISAIYTYTEDGRILSIDDQGTDFIIVEGSEGFTIEPQPVEIDTTEIYNRINQVEAKTVGKLVGSENVQSDIVILSNLVTDLISNQEEMYSRHQLDILNMQFKYDIALNLVSNHCGDFFIDVLQDSNNFLELFNCAFNTSLEKII